MKKISIDLFADIACPWCYLGERRLERAFAQRPDLEAEWHWHPFQLLPDLPRGGMPWEDFVEHRFGGMESAQPLFEQMITLGAAEGIEFNYDRMVSAPNTIDAHRLILFARETGRNREAANALFKAYFTEGKDLSDIDTLIGIATGTGLDEERTRSFLQSEKKVSDVQESQQEAERFGISGVPFYIFNERYALSGAQPLDIFLQAIDKAAEKSDEVENAR
jgi:predicted DsbA family dithiol-disulfide isomerase